MYLAQPEPELLNDVLRDLFRPDLSIERSLATPDVSLRWLDHLRTLEDLPEYEQEEVDQNADVRREKAGQLIGSPWGLGEDLEAVENDDQREVDHGGISNIRRPLCPEDQCAPVDTLSGEGPAEPEVGEDDRVPREELGNSSQILEPKEDLVGTSGNRHEGDQRDGGGDQNTPVRNTIPGAFEKEPGSLLVLRNTK